MSPRDDRATPDDRPDVEAPEEEASEEEASEEEAPRADQRLAGTLVGVLVAPRATFARLAGEPSARPGASAIALLGMLWGGLCFVLWMARREPAGLLVPVPAEHWYLIQGFLSLPILTGLWWLFSEVTHRLARGAGGSGPEPGVRAALGFAYAAPMMLHVGAELLAFLVAGPEGLREVALFSMPAAAAGVWALSALAVRVIHQLGWPASAGTAFAGLLVQALVGALVLR